MRPDPKPVKQEIDRTLTKCKQCGKMYQAFRSYMGVCSYKCGVEYNIEKGIKPKPIVKIKNKSTGGKHYGNARKIKAAMIEQVGYTYCERCKRTDRKLDTHHIMFQSEFPKHPMLHKPINLLIVCRECHDYFHARKENRNQLVEQRQLNTLFKK